MYEYKVETYKVSEVAVSPNIVRGYGIIVTYERIIK